MPVRYLWQDSVIDIRRKTALLLCIAILFVGCTPTSTYRGDIVPEEPNYFDTSQWYIVDLGADVDVFYIVFTECGDYRL